ncbi:hypothetical protein [Paraglaciecola hydrolytica]|uniref:Uncharacterized protein n=1 Tax=Paraglaciecola hydrolytica TaxID=1799789 RepID=A0A136A6K7_9ALTE|nr:hypothetical protein [Paraglaciecola hydrolytica]KXI30844.1 hypothetical protein AX660_05425 [Paraglaciecola hydrolytica]
MTNEVEQLHPEQGKISELYQSLKVEQPSSQVDQSILAQARLQVKPQTSEVRKSTQTATHHNRASKNWRQWQWPVSVAASVLLVSVIFINQYQFFTASQQLYPEAMPTEIEAFSAPQSTQVMADSATSQEFNTNRIESAHQAASEKEAMSVLRSAQFDAVQSEQQKAKKAQSKMQTLAEQQITTQMAPAPEKALNQLVTAQIEQLQNKLVATYALLAHSRKKQATLFDDQQRAQLSDTHGSNMDSITHAEKQELELQVSDLQTKLLQQMHNKLAMQADWQAPQDLVDLLTEQQQAQWAKHINQESNE